MPHQCTNCGRTFADGSKEMLSGCPDCSGTKFQFRPDGFTDDEATDGVSPESASPAGAGSGSPGGRATGDAAESVDARDRPGDAVSRTVGSAAATVRDLVSGSAGPDATAATPHGDATADDDATTDADGDDIIVAESEPIDGEDAAQADARTQVADPDEVPDDGFSPATAAEQDAAVEASDGGDTPISDAPSDPPSTDDAPTPDPDSPAAEQTTDDADRSVAEEPDAERTDRPDLAQLREELNEQFESIRVVEPGQYELNLMELYDREEYIIALQEDGRYSIQVPETWREADV